MAIADSKSEIQRRLQSLARQARGVLVDTVYPRTCAICGHRGDWVCSLCIKDHTPLLPELCCDRCGHPMVHKRCECSNMHPAIVKARATSAYDGWIAKSVQAFKYERERDRAEHLADTMLPAFEDLEGVDVLVPVPLHPRREEWRGFNQAERLAHHLQDRIGAPMQSALMRIRETESQTRSSREDRLANMEGAFAPHPSWSIDRRAHYVLIDDVYTTGATLGACAEVLDAAGARAISVVTVAFDIQRKELELYRSLVRATKPL